jgi:ADP-ribose pyrophosphatase
MPDSKSKTNIYPTFLSNDVEVIDTSTLYNGFFKLVKYQFKHRLFAGGWSDVVERELLTRGQAVALLPYDPVKDQVVMIEQIRVGALGQAQPWQLEIVAGIIDKEESAIEVAKREAVEEAGLNVEQTEHINGFYPSSGGCSERIELFVGKIESPETAGIFGLESENEDIKVHILTRKEAYALVENGTIENASSVIALQWLMLNHKMLRDKWLTRE